MQKRRLIAWIFGLMTAGLISLLNACSLPQVSAEDRLFLPLSLEFLSSYTLSEKTFKNTPIGGLSALTYDRQNDLFYAISDDRSEKAPARFYTLKFHLGNISTKPSLKQFEVRDVTFLKDQNGKSFENRKIDAEGIALSPAKSVFISSEGDNDAGAPPFVGEFDLQTGQLKRKLSLPASYLSDASTLTQQRGIQNNRGFESLTLNMGAARGIASEPFRLFTATEAPLVQDLEPPSPQGGKNRLLHYLIEGDRATLISEHLYQLDPKPTAAFDHGLSELLSIDQAGHFLSLERSFGLQGFQIKVFQVTTGTATDTATIKSLRGPLKGVQPARKRLLLDLTELGIDLDNLEGMTLGPRLPDGSQSLILISDDNFKNLTQVTQLLLFRLKGVKG